MHITRFPLERFRNKKGLPWRRKGNKADGCVQRREGGQVRANRTLPWTLGLAGGEGTATSQRKGLLGVCSLECKAIRAGANTLKPSVLWRETELC